MFWQKCDLWTVTAVQRRLLILSHDLSLRTVTMELLWSHKEIADRKVCYNHYAKNTKLRQTPRIEDKRKVITYYYTFSQID